MQPTRLKETEVRLLVAALTAVSSTLPRADLRRGWRLARSRHVVTSDGSYFKFYPDEGFWYDTGWGSNGRRDCERYASLAALAAAHPEPRPFITAEEAMARWPRLTAHLICESLGYFTPTAAAFAIANHFNGRPHYCEYYEHCFGSAHYQRLGAQLGYEDALRQLGADKLAWTYRTRRSHTGYMSSYRQASALVAAAVAHGDQTLLMSW